MRKEERQTINQEALYQWEKAKGEYRKKCGHSSAPRLRRCKACVYSTDNYYYLRSYDTIVAFIDKRTHIIYDILRYVYGYTSTSAQHINKFMYDYDARKIVRYCN